MAGGGEGVDNQVWLWKQSHRLGLGAADHPAGEIRLGRRSRIAARASALGGVIAALTTVWEGGPCPMHVSTPLH